MKNHVVALTATIFLGACASGGTVINDDGTPKGEVKWPDYTKTQFDHHTGIFPNLENLSHIRPNMSRDQLYQLIGRPHFTEGFHVREWTYVFHFDTPGMGTDGVSTCEYKVLFDTELRAQSYHWKAIDPVDGICPPSGKRQSTYNLSTDALFEFNQSQLKAITAKSYAKLQNLVADLKGFTEISSITVNGYTDRLGSDAYNLRLSQRRAETVRNYLIEQGVKANTITAHGYGEQDPVVTCDNRSKAALIACLMPNRRVAVWVNGYGLLQNQ